MAEGFFRKILASKNKYLTEDTIRQSDVRSLFLLVYTKGLKGFGGIAIGGIVGLDIFFLEFISGAYMNPARSLVPALLSGTLGNLWLYWSATFIGTSTIAFLLRKKFNISKGS
jgi:aquaporin Z